MPNPSLSRPLPPDTQPATTVQNLVSVLISPGLFKASYENIKTFPDGTTALVGTVSVDRDPAVADYSDLLNQAYQLAEQFRQEDVDNKTASDAAIAAEAVRWAALTPDQQKAETDAALAARQAAVDADIAKNGLPDPNPTGLLPVNPQPTPITPAPVA